MNLKDMVKDGKRVTFARYKNHELWYVTECGFEFPVPTADTGDATFLVNDKAVFFMRYIRTHIQALYKARTIQRVENLDNQ